jgi:hypothetical protein
MNLPNPMTGPGALAHWCNRVREFCHWSQLLSGPGYRVKQLQGGRIIEIIPQGGGGKGAAPVGAQRFRVKSVASDYLTCHFWDGTTEAGSDVKIAKPPELRHSLASQTINGVAVTYDTFAISGGVCTRTAHPAGAADQLEMVLPVYQIAGAGADAEIWADQPAGGTGVAAAADWMDTNRDGRAWCQVG